MQRIGRSIRSHRDKTVELSLDRTVEGDRPSMGCLADLNLLVD